MTSLNSTYKRLILALLAMLLAGWAHAEPPARKLPKYPFKVHDGFPNAQTFTVTRVLHSAADELMQYFPDRKFKPIEVKYRADGPPQMFYIGGTGGNHKIDRVYLNAKSTFWAQYIYQFAHEHCHILHNADLLYPHEAAWFGEALSELASLFVLRSLAETWRTKPPFKGWEWFTSALRKYADGIMKGRELPEGWTLAMWYQENKTELQKNSLNRPLNAVAACALLPLFEGKPERWEALSWMCHRRDELKEKKLTFQEFLKEWSHHCPKRHKPFIERIGKEFGLHFVLRDRS